MDKIIFPSILNNVIVDKDNLKIKHTREGQAEIETIEGRSEFIEESFSHVGELNQETNKYDIEITTSKEYENEYTEKSSSIISIDRPLKSTPSGLCDKIYKHGDNYKLLTQIGEKPFEQEYNKESLEKGESIVLENSNKNNLIEIEEIWGNTWQDDTDSKNLFDGELRQGDISSSDGQDTTSSLRVSSVNFIPVNNSKVLYIYRENANGNFAFRCYDNNKNILGTTEANRTQKSFSLSLLDGTSYVRFIDETNDLTNKYSVAIESITAYEPYHKADLSNIKHLGELYVDESGQPILDSDGREQYKIEIKSFNDNLNRTDDIFVIDGSNQYPEIKLDNTIFKPNTNYEVIIKVLENTLEEDVRDFTAAHVSVFNGALEITIPRGFIGEKKVIKSTVPDFTNRLENYTFRYALPNTTKGSAKIKVCIRERETLGEVGYIPHQSHKTSILLPCQLCKVSDVADRLYWNSENRKYIVEKNILQTKLLSFRSKYGVFFQEPVIEGKFDKENIDSAFIRTKGLVCQGFEYNGYNSPAKTQGNLALSFPSNLSGRAYPYPDEEWTLEEVNSYIGEGKDLYAKLTTPQLVETNVLEQAILPCYKDKTYIDILSNSITGTFKANLLTPKITDFPYIDEINDAISDGTTLLYPLPKNEITETDIEIDNQITTYGTDTTFEFNGAIPKITLNKVPNDYAYNESRSLAKGEVIDVESFEDIDTTKTIEIKSIEGQTYQNLMQDPIKNSIAKYSIDMQGETIEVSDWKAEQDVEIKEIHGNTFVNMLEDKVDSAIVKNIATYQGKVIDGSNEIILIEVDKFEFGKIINSTTGEVSDASNIWVSNFVKVKPSKEINFKNKVNTSYYNLYLYDKDYNYIGYIGKNTNDFNCMISEGCSFVRILLPFSEAQGVSNIGVTISYISSDNNLDKYTKLTVDEIQGNTMQNLIVNPNNVEETCEFIYSGNDTTHTIENSTISKITVDELLGNTWQNSEDLSDIRSVGELQEDGSYKIDILSKNNLFPYNCTPIDDSPVLGKLVVTNIQNGFNVKNTAHGNYQCVRIELTKLKSGVEYRLKAKARNYLGSTIDIYMKSGLSSGEFKNETTGDLNINKTFTLDSGVTKASLYLYITKQTADANVDFYDFCLTEANIDTEPKFHKTTILLPCQLMKVGDISDKLYWDSVKGKYVIEKNVGKTNANDFWEKDTGNEMYYLSCSYNSQKPKVNTGMFLGQHGINKIVYGRGGVYYNGESTVLNGKFQSYSDEYINSLVPSELYYQLETPQIIETEYTNPNLLQFDTYDEVTYIDSTPSDTSIEPNIVINSNGVERECLLKANTKYIVKFNTSLDSEIDLGGTKLNVLSTDNQIEITTPSTLVHNQLRVAKESAIIKDLMVLEGTYENELHIPYMEGINSYGDYDEESGKYRVELICYNIDRNEEQKLTFLLDEPLRRIGSISDRLYFDNEKGYYCVKRKIEKIKFSNDDIWESAWGETTNYIGIKNTKDLPIDTHNVNLLCDKLPQEQYVSLSSKDYEWVCLANTSINLKIKKNKLTSLDSAGINKYCEDLNILYTTKTPVIEELTEYTSNTLKCYNNKTSIEGNNFISPNLITATTLPLSTKALIKPNTKYTMFMDTDCDINYNLGGLEGVYLEKNTLGGNLLDYAMIESGTIDTETGLDLEHSNMARSNFLQVNPNSIINGVNEGGFTNIVLSYDNNKKFISKIYHGISVNFTITTPINCAYIRIVSNVNLMLNPQRFKYSITGSGNKNSILLTTPSTLSNSTLTLLGEGNVRNVTLLEGDYINSYIPDTFIDEIKSVGDYDEESGKYKVEVIINNSHKKTILLEEPLRKVGNVSDRLYWDNTRGKVCIEKNIAFKSEDINFNSNGFVGLTSSNHKSQTFILCDKYRYLPWNIKTNDCISSYNNGVALRLYFAEGDSKENYPKNIKYCYQLNTPQIIETDIIEPLIATLSQGNTIITTENEVKPNLWIYDGGLEKEVSIAPSTTYYLSANTENDIQVDLGGAVVNYLSTDTIKSITTPSTLNSNTIKFMGNGYVKDVMLRVDNREDIPYFEGLENVGEYDEVSGKYKIEIISKGTNVVLDEKVIFLNNPLRKGDYILPNGNIIRGDSEDIEIIEDMPIMEFAVDGISYIDSNNLIKPIISASIPTKSIRKLEKPTEISIVSNEDKHTISWTGDKGVESYDIRLNDEIIQTVDYTNTSWVNDNEMSGDITITAKNHLIESDKSDGLNILTIPNQCKLTSFDCIYKDNLYQMVIGFEKNSNIANGYKIKYTLDNGEIVEEELTDLDNVVGQHQISLPVIEDKIDVKIYPYNEAGSNEYKDYKSFYVTPTPLWTYLTSNDNFLFRIKDRFNFETWYNLKTKSSDNMGRFDGSLDWNDYPIGGNEGINGLLIDYTLQTHPEEELLVSAVMNDGEFNHIPSIPFRASKILDITLLAPKGFKMEWVDDGVAKFSWEDNYVNENYFEFSYSLNGGIEEHIRIDSSSVETDGKIYSYTYKFDEYGVLSARVRMVWELNTSAYTDSKTATFVEVTGLPPSWIVKKYDGDNLVVSWEAQSYVEKYEVKIECDGATEILDIVQDMFNLDLNKYHGKDVRISIRTHFTTGLITEYSDSISFKPVSESQVINNISYRPIKVEKDNNVRITTKINEIFTSYQRVVNTINNESVLHTKICKEMIGVEALLNNTFYNIVNEKYSNNIMVSTPNVESKFNIYAKTYKQVEIDKLLNSYIYTPILSKFTDFISIQKVTIVCIGDSITAGHPLYWAESNTGVIEAQYPYWLSKRLNGQYNVINKGFGSDRTFNVLARFKKDVLDLNPQYCIIQAGTNDIYWGSAEAGDDYTKFDKTLNDMKNNIMQCVQLCFDNDIIPIIGNLIPRTQAVTIPMVKYGLIEFNKWIAEYANETEGVSYVDFFNAGKNSLPPTPLEDPDNPYALNPLYDGDTRYDAQGNVISQGAGIHLNIDGYRIMAEAIPLNYFKATSTGIKMYLDSDCTKEENYNNDDALYPFYTIKLDDLKLGRTKTIVRYLKNIGDSQVVFAMYQANGYNINYTFENEDKSTQDYVSGILLPDRKVKVTMNITPLMEDSKAAITLFVAGRQFTQN